MKTIDPGLSAWGSRLSHHLTLLCQGLRYLKLLREQHLRPTEAGETTEPRTPPRNLEHPWALSAPSCQHGPSAPSRRAQATPPANHRHCQAKAGLDTQRLQGGHDASGAVVACSMFMKNWVFTLGTLSWRDMVTFNGAPAGKAKPRGRRHHCHRHR
jgi:hypothetical protein